MEKIKVVHFFGKMDMGGAETFIMNVYRKIYKKAEFHFIVTNHQKGKYDDEIMELGGKIHVVKLNKNLINYYKEIRRIIKIEKIDVGHTHVHHFSGVNSFLLKKIGVQNIIAHSHSTKDGQKGNAYRLIYRSIMEKLILRYSNTRIACTKEAGNSLFGEEKNFKIIRNGIDLGCFRKKIDITKKKRELGISEEAFIIGHVGRFEEVKNHDFLLNLIKNIMKREKHSDIELVLIGTGVRENKIREKCKEYGLSKKVKFLGNRNDIHEIMQIFDAFVFPSIYEGLGIALVEAQASGLRCITSKGVPKEVDLTGNVEFLSLEENYEVWENEIFNGWHKNNKNELEKYDINKISKKLYEIYAKV